MALHHPGAALLVLSTLLGIISSLQASNTPLIPIDQLTVEQAYVEVFLVEKQLYADNPPYFAAEQKDIYDSIYSSFSNVFNFLKPNDLLSNILRQKMSHFRQAFTNWGQPVKPGTIEYQIIRGLALTFMYERMLQNIDRVVSKADTKYQIHKEAVSRAWTAWLVLKKVHREVREKYENSSSLVKPEDVNRLKVAIKVARDAVMATPMIDENGELVSGTSSSPSKKSTSNGFLLEESPNEADVGASTSTGQIEDSTAGGGDFVRQDGVVPDGPPVSSAGDPVGPNGVSPSRPASNLPGGSSSRKPRNKLFHLLKRPYVWGAALVLAAGAGYYFLRSHPVSSSGDLYSLSTISLNVSSLAFEGSNHHLWYFLTGGLVALIVLLSWWCCFKTRGTPSKDRVKAASKRASQTSQQLVTTIGTPGSVGTAST